MRNRHPRTAVTLVGMGIVLLVAIVLGQQIGNHTIFGSTERKVVIPGQTITPVPEEAATGADEAVLKNWKRLQVVSVATDPAFPDPRVTPPPTPSPRPSPSPKATPSPRPADLYTSPPLAVPIASHDPTETTPPY
jgi:hypothetical protein